MSKFYMIEKSTDVKVIGKDYPQCTGVLKGYNNEHGNQRSLYNFAHKKGERIDFTPDLESIKIGTTTKWTDIISCSLGPGCDLVISKRLSALIMKHRTSEIQLFDCVLHKKEDRNQYHWYHFVFNLEKCLDYDKSIFYHPDKEIAQQLKNIKSLETFEHFYKEIDKFGFIKARKCVIRFSPLDFFTIGRVNQHCYVSEKLKDEIEKAAYTGIEFKPANDIQFKDVPKGPTSP